MPRIAFICSHRWPSNDSLKERGPSRSCERASRFAKVTDLPLKTVPFGSKMKIIKIFGWSLLCLSLWFCVVFFTGNENQWMAEYGVNEKSIPRDSEFDDLRLMVGIIILIICSLGMIMLSLKKSRTSN